MSSDFGSLQKIIGNLALTNVEAIKLNRAALKVMKKGIRENIRNQRDKDGAAFKPRSQSKFVVSRGGRITKTAKMFQKIATKMKATTSADKATLFFAGKTSKIATIHNYGKSVNFKTSTGKNIVYNMPKREFFGLTNKMKQQAAKAIADEFLKTIRKDIKNAR